MSLYFTEFAGLGRPFVKGTVAGANAVTQCAAVPSLASGSITLSGVNQQSAAFNGQTNLVRVTATVAAWIAFGTNPVATTTPRIYMPAGTTEYFAVEPGHKLAGVTV